MFEKNETILAKRIAFSILTLMIIAFIIACQPTPESPAVIYGRDLEEKIARSSASLAAYDALEAWQETIKMEGSSATITIDAVVSVPDVTAFSVYKAEKAPFNNESVKPLLDCFLQGRDVIKHTPATKSLIEEQLVYARKDGDEEWIKYLEQMYQDAPETAAAEYITDWTLDGNEKRLQGYITLNDGHYAGINLSANNFGYGYGFIWKDDLLKANGMEQVGEVSISPEDAVKAAEQMLGELGIDYMAVYSMQKAQMNYRTGISEFPQYSDTPSTKGYEIKFVRCIDGISAVANEGGITHYKDEFAYTAPFHQEEMSVYVDEQGEVQKFGWNSPLKLTEMVSENTVLMPFEDMQQRIRDMLFFVFSYGGQSITVDRIEMKMAMVNVLDDPDEAMFVPSWFIHCIQETERGYMERTLVLNAIDGGRVKEFPNDPIPEEE